MLHWLAGPLFWVAALLCIVAEIAILRATFMLPRRIDDDRPVPASPRAIEMVWAIIPAIVLALLLGATWRALQ